GLARVDHWVRAPERPDDRAAFRTTATPRPNGTAPSRLPEVTGYDVLEELGFGGMGVVYKARQRSLNRVVALKMILAGARAAPAERERFRREAEVVAHLRHPNIVQIYELGEQDNIPYLALEYVDGGSLAQAMGDGQWTANGKENQQRAARLIETIARAV